MTNEEAISVLSANVMFACDRALFDMATKRCIEDALDKAIDALEEQKTGRWTSLYIGDVYEGYCFCSKCRTGFKIKTNYCPNCGAKMIKS